MSILGWIAILLCGISNLANALLLTLLQRRVDKLTKLTNDD